MECYLSYQLCHEGIFVSCSLPYIAAGEPGSVHTCLVGLGHIVRLHKCMQVHVHLYLLHLRKGMIALLAKKAWTG